MAWASGEYLLHYKMHSTYDMYDTGFNANLLMHKNSMYFLSLKNNALSIHNRVLSLLEYSIKHESYSNQNTFCRVKDAEEWSY